MTALFAQSAGPASDVEMAMLMTDPAVVLVPTLHLQPTALAVGCRRSPDTRRGRPR